MMCKFLLQPNCIFNNLDDRKAFFLLHFPWLLQFVYLIIRFTSKSWRLSQTKLPGGRGENWGTPGENMRVINKGKAQYGFANFFSSKESDELIKKE